MLITLMFLVIEMKIRTFSSFFVFS